MSLTPEQIEAGWVEHDGKGLPVPSASRVSVMLRGNNGEPTPPYYADAWDWLWSRMEPSGDIIAYRPEPKP